MWVLFTSARPWRGLLAWPSSWRTGQWSWAQGRGTAGPASTLKTHKQVKQDLVVLPIFHFKDFSLVLEGYIPFGWSKLIWSVLFLMDTIKNSKASQVSHWSWTTKDSLLWETLIRTKSSGQTKVLKTDLWPAAGTHCGSASWRLCWHVQLSAPENTSELGMIVVAVLAIFKVLLIFISIPYRSLGLVFDLIFLFMLLQKRILQKVIISLSE